VSRQLLAPGELPNEGGFHEFQFSCSVRRFREAGAGHESTWEIQDLLISGNGVDPGILTDFRDAVNRIRNTAWAIQQYAESKTTETDPQAVLSVLAGERVCVAYQLARLVHADLAKH
jgi:hypothetical protein